MYEVITFFVKYKMFRFKMFLWRRLSKSLMKDPTNSTMFIMEAWSTLPEKQ